MEIAAHLLNRAFRHFEGGSPPSGMDCGNSAIAAIEEQNWDAIGGPDTDTLSYFICDKRVSFALSISEAVRIQHTVGVDLPECDIGGGITEASAKAVFLPKELLKGVALVDAVAREAK